MRARGARGQHWYNDRRTELARKNSRTQALWYLHLAGDWSEAFETQASAIRPHMMRCMLVSNLALDQRFANVDGINGNTIGKFGKCVCVCVDHPMGSRAPLRFGPKLSRELTPSTGTARREGFCAGSLKRQKLARPYRALTLNCLHVLLRRAP